MKRYNYAPSGRISSLGKDDYWYVRSKEFQRRFGDWKQCYACKSEAQKLCEDCLQGKYLDEKGEPLALVVEMIRSGRTMNTLRKNLFKERVYVLDYFGECCVIRKDKRALKRDGKILVYSDTQEAKEFASSLEEQEDLEEI